MKLSFCHGVSWPAYYAFHVITIFAMSSIVAINHNFGMSQIKSDIKYKIYNNNNKVKNFFKVYRRAVNH